MSKEVCNPEVSPYTEIPLTWTNKFSPGAR